MSNANLELISPALVASAVRHGIALECFGSAYGQIIQTVLNPRSSIYQAHPDAVLLAVDYRGLPLTASVGRADVSQSTIGVVAEHLRTIRDAIHDNSDAVCIFQTLAAPPETVFGSIERQIPGTIRFLVDATNKLIVESVAGDGDVVLDVASIAETVGLSEWHCPRQWNLAKLPFSETYLPMYADHVGRLIGALKGKSRRCLILDLDNTLWGGVIGDDGLDGIKITQGDPSGEAHLSLQRYILGLRDRGIVLAVSSKNEDDTARMPFRHHPEMVLRENHFAIFQANWNDKATNIVAIAEELSLGLDSMVLLDDNPAERELVRRMLPQVAVPELPDEPALYARTLAAAGYFECVSFSMEDARRADFYEDNARRVVLKQQAGDLESYLLSLDMEITFQPFDETGRKRITQLINKSNQFNLTTRRYSESEVARLECDPNCFNLQVRLSDIFGDNGMICVVICRQNVPEEWEIDSWLMSCRVLGRQVEPMVLRELIASARERGISRLVGRYVPTERNLIVADHYPKLGFSQIDQQPDGITIWSMDVNTAEVKPAPMRVKRLNLTTQ